MKNSPPKDAQVLLKAILSAWPKDGSSDVSLDVNAIFLGEKIGLNVVQVKEAVDSLERDGLLHAREVDDVILVHPTPFALSKRSTLPVREKRFRDQFIHALKQIYRTFIKR